MMAGGAGFDISEMMRSVPERSDAKPAPVRAVDATIAAAVYFNEFSIGSSQTSADHVASLIMWNLFSTVETMLGIG
jgi:hypothetical protein